MGNGPFTPVEIKKRLLAAAIALDSAVDEIDSDRFFRRCLHTEVDKLRRSARQLTTRESMLDVVAALVGLSGYLLGFEDWGNPRLRLRAKRFSQGVGDQYFTLRKAIPHEEWAGIQKNWKAAQREMTVKGTEMPQFLVWFRDRYPDLYHEVF